MKKPLLALVAFPAILLTGCRNLGTEMSKYDFYEKTVEMRVLDVPNYEKVETKGKLKDSKSNETTDLSATLIEGLPSDELNERRAYTFLHSYAPFSSVMSQTTSLKENQVKFFINEEKIEFSIKIKISLDDTYIDVLGHVVKSNAEVDTTYTWNKYLDLIYLSDKTKTIIYDDRVVERNIEFSATCFYK